MKDGLKHRLKVSFIIDLGGLKINPLQTFIDMNAMSFHCYRVQKNIVILRDFLKRIITFLAYASSL